MIIQGFVYGVSLQPIGYAIAFAGLVICLQNECIFLEDLIEMPEEEIKKYDCIIVDEVQFATKEQIDYLSDIVDFMDVPVVAYGLRADFRNKLFPGSERPGPGKGKGQTEEPIH